MYRSYVIIKQGFKIEFRIEFKIQNSVYCGQWTENSFHIVTVLIMVNFKVAHIWMYCSYVIIKQFCFPFPEQPRKKITCRSFT